MSETTNLFVRSVVEEANASKERPYVNPFVHVDEEEQKVSAAFIHHNDDKTAENKLVLNPFIHCDVREDTANAPAVKAFLHEGDPGFDSALSFTTESGEAILAPAAETTAVAVSTIAPVASASAGGDNLAYKFAKELVARCDIRRCLENLYVRNGNTHEIITDFNLERLIYSYIELKLGSVKSGQINEVKKLIRADNNVKEETSSNPNYIALENVILDNRLLTVTPDWNIFLTHRISASYRPELIGKCPVMNQFVAGVMNGNAVLVKRLWQILALVFCNLHVKKFVVLYGPHDSGKSVLINLVSHLYKCEDRFSLTLNQFGKPFVLNQISGCKLAVCADLPNKVLDGIAIGNVKAITGGDEVNAQKKFGDPHILDTEGGIRLVFSTNHEFVLANNDPAFYERILYLPFLNTVPKEKRDPNLRDKLWAERDAIVTTALQYLPELLATNFTFAGEEETDAMLSVYNAFANRDFSGIVEDFVVENIELAPDVFTSTDELLKAFAERTDVVIDISNFGKYLKEALFRMSPAITEARATINGIKHRGYRGIRIKEADV